MQKRLYHSKIGRAKSHRPASSREENEVWIEKRGKEQHQKNTQQNSNKLFGCAAEVIDRTGWGGERMFGCSSMSGSIHSSDDKNEHQIRDRRKNDQTPNE